MVPFLAGLLRVGPPLEFSFSGYLYRALLHLLAVAGVAFLIRGIHATASAVPSAFGTGTGRGATER